MAGANEEMPEQEGVTVETIFQIKTKEHSKGIVIPAELLVCFEDKHYMKLVASKFWLCKFICPQEAKHVKNISLASTSQFKALNEAVWAEFTKDENEDGKAQLFEDAKSKKPLKRKRTSALETKVKQVTLPDNSMAEFYVECPKAAPAVRVQAEDLAAVCNYLKGACQECGQGLTRSYSKSGKFAKK